MWLQMRKVMNINNDDIGFKEDNNATTSYKHIIFVRHVLNS